MTWLLFPFGHESGHRRYVCPIDKGQTCDNYSWLSALLHLELAKIQKLKERL